MRTWNDSNTIRVKGGNFLDNGNVIRSTVFVDNFSIIQSTQRAPGLPSVAKLSLLLAERHSKPKTIILCLCNLLKGLTWAIIISLLNTWKDRQCRYFSACRNKDSQPCAVVFNLSGINRDCSGKVNRRYWGSGSILQPLGSLYERNESPQQCFSNHSLIHVNSLRIHSLNAKHVFSRVKILKSKNKVSFLWASQNRTRPNVFK